MRVVGRLASFSLAGRPRSSCLSPTPDAHRTQHGHNMVSQQHQPRPSPFADLSLSVVTFAWLVFGRQHQHTHTYTHLSVCLSCRVAPGSPHEDGQWAAYPPTPPSPTPARSAASRPRYVPLSASCSAPLPSAPPSPRPCYYRSPMSWSGAWYGLTSPGTASRFCSCCCSCCCCFMG